MEMQGLNPPYGFNNNSETPRMRDGLADSTVYWKSIGQNQDAIPTSSQHRAEQIVTNNKKRREVDNQSGTKVCARCAKELETSEEGISFKDTVYHEFCFSCSECYLPLANTNYYVKGGAIHCQEHANDITQPRQFKAFMSIQPESYQIANYNIYPSPQITFDRELDRDAIITVSLVENETHSVVGQGFRNSDTNRELTVGVQAKTFTGLKLSKKSVIKSYLKHLNLKKPNQVTFCIKFTINNISWYSRSFKILSSCSQLPPHLRDTIRPFAVNNNNGNVSPPPTVTSVITPNKNRGSPIEPPSITESEYLHSILPPPPNEISPPLLPPSHFGNNISFNVNHNNQLVRPPPSYKYSPPPPSIQLGSYPSPPPLLQQTPSPLNFMSVEEQKALSIMRMMERVASSSTSASNTSNENQNQDPRIT